MNYPDAYGRPLPLFDSRSVTNAECAGIFYFYLVHRRQIRGKNTVNQLLLGTVIGFIMNCCWRFITWVVGVLTLPARALYALQREKMMERHLQEVESELKNLVWDNKELQAHLKVAIKEQDLMESILAELEEEHDKAIVKIELLEREVHDLRQENTQLRETHGKGFWGHPTNLDVDTFDIHPMISEDHLKRKATQNPNPTLLVDPLTPLFFSSTINPDKALDQRHEVALSQSLFSAGLSLIVGLIIYEAEDPCMPLVVALYFVVGMSLRSVVQFFSTIKNRPASGAVSLLCLNWFVLGTLTYPTLPWVARLLSPMVCSIVDRLLGGLRVGSV